VLARERVRCMCRSISEGVRVSGDEAVKRARSAFRGEGAALCRIASLRSSYVLYSGLLIRSLTESRSSGERLVTSIRYLVVGEVTWRRRNSCSTCRNHSGRQAMVQVGNGFKAADTLMANWALNSEGHQCGCRQTHKKSNYSLF